MDKDEEEIQDEFIAYNPDPSDTFKMFVAVIVATITVCAVIGLGLIQVVRIVAKPILKRTRRKSN